MSDKDISLRSAIFIVIGILLSLSLVICIYLVNGEKDLVAVDARVIYVKENIDGNGKNESTVTYRVNNVNYEYSFYYKKSLKVDDTVKIYYHSKNPMNVQSIKTSYLIFVCPSVGLLLCIIGLIGLFRKPKRKDINHEEDLIKTQVIEINGNTQKLEIIANDNEEQEYVKSIEEEQETPIKELVNKDKDDLEEDSIFEKRSNKHHVDKKEETPAIEDENDAEEIIEEKEEVIDEDQNVLDHYEEIFSETTKINIDEYLLNKDRNNTEKKSLSKIIPKYYYITGNTLVYEVYGEESREINFSDIKQVIRTINSEGTLIKVLVNTKNVSCLLTNMNKVNLQEISNLLHNKMLDLDLDYDEIVEYKEF